MILAIKTILTFMNTPERKNQNICNVSIWMQGL